MLDLLRNIMYKLQSLEDLNESLHFVASSVRAALKAEYTAIFLLNASQSGYQRVAIETKRKNMTFSIPIPLNIPFKIGLINLISEREEAIRCHDITPEIEFCNRATKWERQFRSFLGIPLISKREVLGVLIVQRHTIRGFSEKEEAFLSTLGLQLAEIIFQTQLKQSLRSTKVKFDKGKKLYKPVTLSGVVGSPGIAIGKAVIVTSVTDLNNIPSREIDSKNIEKEIQLFKDAIKKTRNEINEFMNMNKSLSSVEQALFTVYLQILKDRRFLNQVVQGIKNKQWAKGALKRVIDRYVAKFDSLEDTYLRERGTDFKDLAKRILFYLQSAEKKKHQYPSQVILVGEEISVTTIMSVPQGALVGIVSVSGSINSHVAILARDLAVTAIMGIGSSSIPYLSDNELILDGYSGQVYVKPPPYIKKEFLKFIKEEKAINENLEKIRHLPAETLDGHILKLYVNAGLIADADFSLSAGAEGVGLYRTEMPFMLYDRLPSEDEQYALYRNLLQSFHPKPVVMRTLDVGGDKKISYLSFQEDNPFLGWRGIRITLDHPDLFLQQIKAMLRASEDLNNLSIMLPMIMSINEIELSLALIHQAREELLAVGHNIQQPKIGVMIEIPAAVYQIKEFSTQIDFFSVGSNDLIQYLLAVDRNNSRVASLYESLHPSVLRVLSEISKAAHKAHRPVSICGGLASEPLAIVPLVAMGFDVLSMNSHSLLKIKSIIRRFSLSEARNLLTKLLKMDDAVDIRNELFAVLEAKELSYLIRAGE
jgi:phosphotransferase system enzyme I (PtsP)